MAPGLRLTQASKSLLNPWARPHPVRRRIPAAASALAAALTVLPWAHSQNAGPSAGDERLATTNGLALVEAIRQTLDDDPVIRLQDQAVAFASGRAQEESGRFDARVASALIQSLTQRAEPQSSVVNTPTGTQTTTDLERLVNQETTLRAGIDQPLRSGLTVGPLIDVTHSENNLADVDPQNRARVNFNVIVPLARGLGTRVATASERAARIDYEASRLSLEHVIAERILNTVVAYWNYQAAAQQFDIVQASEARAQDLYDNTRLLVEAQEVAAAELDQIEANLAAKSRARIGASQSLFEARQGLGLAMGLGYERVDLLPSPTDTFPEHRDSQIPETLTVAGLYETAMQHRADLKASLLAEESATALLLLARNDLKPQIDLTMQVGYEGFDDSTGVGGALSAFSENVEGVSGLVALSFNWPFRNNQAKGRLLQQQSVHEQTVVRYQDLARTIRSGLAVALSGLRHGLEELEKAEQAGVAYAEAVENERQKQRLGLSSFTDVLLIEDRLTSAELDFLLARLRYATSLARLRFESGLILAEDASGRSVGLNEVSTLPNLPRSTPTHREP